MHYRRLHFICERGGFMVSNLFLFFPYKYHQNNISYKTIYLEFKIYRITFIHYLIVCK